MLADVCRSLRSIRGDKFIDVQIRQVADGLIDAVFVADRPDCDLLVHACCVVIATRPIDICGISILPVLSFASPSDYSDREACGQIGISDSEPPDATSKGEQGNFGALSAFSGYAGSYSSEMAAAGALLGVIGANAAHLAWQPVRHADDRFGVLYEECVIHVLDHDGFMPCLNDQVLAVERIGASPALDCYTVSRAIDELRVFSDACLGVSISSLSASLGFWWTEVFARLADDRAIANRLFIEIKATAPFPPFGNVVAFVDHMRRLGCKIILGDFGVGFSSIRSIIALRPDAIKIDPFFLHRASRSEKDREVFFSLTRLATTLTTGVIVMGVDTAEQAAMAREAGALWQQGRYHGSARFSRRWAAQSPDHARSTHRLRSECRTESSTTAALK